MSEMTLAALQQLGRAELLQRWEVVFGRPAPSHTRAPLLLGALAWHLQMQQTQRRSGEGTQRVAPASVPSMLRKAQLQSSGGPMAAGTRLVREWQGKLHEVCVLADGFEYDGKAYRSLSAIARAITGTAWSGPLFFGLRR
jgi:hypothetical protein